MNNLQSTLAGLQPLSDNTGRLQTILVNDAVPLTPAQDSSRNDILTTNKPVETLGSNNKPVEAKPIEPQSVNELIPYSTGKTKKVVVNLSSLKSTVSFYW